MIYLFKNGTKVLFFADLSEAKRVYGLETPDKTITDAEFEQANGMARIIDGEIFVGKTDVEKLADAQKSVRETRDRLLNTVVDKVQGVLRWNGMTAEQQTAWSDYRTALLNIPEQKIFSTDPANVEWPEQPAE